MPDATTVRLDDSRIENPLLALVLPIIAITLWETLLFFGYQDVMLYGHLATLFYCLFAPLRVSDEVNLLSVFALVPLFRLVNLGMPVFLDLTIYWYPLVYAPLIPAIFLIARSSGISTPRFDVEKAGLFLFPGLILGALLGLVEYLIISPSALVPTWTPANILLIGIVMFGFVGFVEELLFRGLLQRHLEQTVGVLPGLVVANFLFGMMHSAYGSSLEIVFAGLIGLLFGIIYDWTESVLLISIIHGTLNVVLFGFIPHNQALIPW